MRTHVLHPSLTAEEARDLRDRIFTAALPALIQRGFNPDPNNPPREIRASQIKEAWAIADEAMRQRED